MSDRRYFDANQRHWDEVADLHPTTAFYRFHLDRLKVGGTSLHDLEIAEVGDVAGKRLLHLQCHIGTESISWAKRGAVVTAMDFSPHAIAQAEQLAADHDVRVRFVQANIYDLPQLLDESFDVVYTSWGVLGWLPDIPGWAEIAGRYTDRGGTFYIAEFHPTAWIFDETADDLLARWPYFPGAEPLLWEEDGSYADPHAKLQNRRTYSWQYTLGDVVSSLIGAGLRIDFLHEFAGTPYQMMKVLRLDTTREDRWYRMRDGLPSIPLAFSLRARKP